MTIFYIFDGSGKDQTVDLPDSSIYIGRALDNTIQIKDITVSRRHLKIVNRENRYFIMDLQSKNGTYLNGNYINPGIEIELKEGVPIVIGMSVICMGRGCLENVVPFLDSLDDRRRLDESGEIPDRQRTSTIKKNMELVHKVDNVIMESLDIHEMSEKILYCILDSLKRIDRGAIILINENEPEGISEITVSRSGKTVNDTASIYSRPVVDQVIHNERAVLILDVQKEAEEVNLSDTLKLSMIGSVMCVPLIKGSKIRGVIYVDSIKNPHGFREEDLELFTILSDRVTPAMEDALLKAHLPNN